MVLMAMSGILITVLTLAIRSTLRALVPESSRPPNPASACVLPQPIRARNLSSERMETAFKRRMMTVWGIH